MSLPFNLDGPVETKWSVSLTFPSPCSRGSRRPLSLVNRLTFYTGFCIAVITQRARGGCGLLGVNFPPKFCLRSGSHRFGFGALNLEELKGVDVLGGDADFCLGANLPPKLCVLGGSHRFGFCALGINCHMTCVELTSFGSCEAFPLPLLLLIVHY
jgi:hypothetical protein